MPHTYSTQPEAGPSRGSLQAQEAWDGLPSYGDKPTILPTDFTIPSSFDRSSIFFQVLTATFKPLTEILPTWPRWKPPQAHRDKCRAMVHFTTPSKEEESPSDDVPPTHGISPPELLLYKPHGRWEWSAGLPIDDPKPLLSLRSIMCSASIDTGLVAGKQIKYICRKWNTSRRKEWIGFHSELALYTSEQYLKTLQGDVVPTIIGVHVMPEAISITMELPHDSFWIESSPTMPDVLKDRVIAAFEKIHARGVLHGDPELRHMLIGADGRVTIIDFGMSRAITADESVDLERAEPEEFLLEMRKVKYKLDYQGARKKEADKVQAYLDRVRRNLRRRRKWDRRKNGEKTGYISPYESEPEDEVMEPPVHHQDFKEDWIKAADDTPHRVVVPGQTEAGVASEVQKFIGIVADMAPKAPSDHDTLTTALTTAFIRSKRKFDDAFELPSTWPFPLKRGRFDSPESSPPCKYNNGSHSTDAIQDDQLASPGVDLVKSDCRRLKRVTFGGQSHRHIDAETGRIIHCGEKTRLSRQCSHPKCLRSRCKRDIRASPSAPSVQPQSVEAPGRSQHLDRLIAPRGILKRKRVDDPRDGQLPDHIGAKSNSGPRNDADTLPARKRARIPNPLQSPPARRPASRRRRGRAGTVINLAPDPVGFVLPAWRIFSTFVTSLIPWRR
ncbi:hypothetical protein V8B97DRAFT_1918738 [Scleroderma yunnanense]